jgi:hypothetical protein
MRRRPDSDLLSSMLITGEVAEDKMADFVLLPNLGSGSELDIAIQNKAVVLTK